MKGKNNSDVKYIIVQFDDESSGEQHRANYPGLTVKYKEKNGTVIKRYQLEHQVTSTKGWRSAAKAKLQQFPLRLNYAQTSHRMQVIYFFSNKITSTK